MFTNALHVVKVESQRDKLSKQLEELFQIRRTEPEKALEEQEKQFEARLKGEFTSLDGTYSLSLNVFF